MHCWLYNSRSTSRELVVKSNYSLAIISFISHFAVLLFSSSSLKKNWNNKFVWPVDYSMQTSGYYSILNSTIKRKTLIVYKAYNRYTERYTRKSFKHLNGNVRIWSKVYICSDLVKRLYNVMLLILLSRWPSTFYIYIPSHLRLVELNFNLKIMMDLWIFY